MSFGLLIDAVCASVFILASASCADSQPDRQTAPGYPPLAEARAAAAVECSAALDEEVTFNIQFDQAVRVVVEKSDLGIGEYLLYFSAADGIMWRYAVDSQGNQIGRDGGTPFRFHPGCITQIGRLPCMAIVRWETEGEGMSGTFVISTDKVRNRDELLRPGSRGGGLVPLVRTEDCHAPMELSQTERMAGFVRFWSEVKYNFVYFDQVPHLDWDAVLMEYLPRVQHAATLEAYYDQLRLCAALLQDGHTSVYGPAAAPEGGLPVCLESLSGQAVVTAVAGDVGLMVGDEVLEIDGEPVRDILQREIYPRICASTLQGRNLKAIPELGGGPLDVPVNLTVRGTDGRIRQVQVVRVPDGIRPDGTRAPFFRRQDEIGIVSIYGFGDESVVRAFEAALADIRQVEGLVIDVRQNGGGSSGLGNQIIGMLIDRPIRGTVGSTRKYLPSHRAWGRDETWEIEASRYVSPRGDRPFLGPVVVLTGPRTASAAEDFVAVLQAAGRATLVGERTNGSTGQPLFIDLPGGGRARICTRRTTYPDGREFVGIGVIPDVEVQPAPQDIATGQDVVLKKGMQVLRQMGAMSP